MTLEEFFWSKVAMIPFHDCWEWIGNRDTYGYGILKKDGKRYKAHRYSVSLVEPLIPKLVVDHKCRNKGCVNPNHLRQVTAGQNILENSINQSAINKAKTHCKRGHEFSEQNTYKYSYGRSCKTCVRNRCKN